MLALKRIPKTWEDIKFQDHIVKVFTGAISKKELPRVVLLKGPSGVGKTSIAKVYSAYLKCTSPKKGNPCGKCESCKSIFEGTSSNNMFYVNGREEGGVAFYRQFVSELQNKASLFGSTKIVIIDEAHGLSNEALEVLLTPLENPSNSHLYVILCTTEGLKIPKSLQSRALSLVVERPDDMDLAKYLNSIISDEKWGVSEDFCVDGILSIIDGTQGNVRECLNTLWNLYLANSFTVEAVNKILSVSGDLWASDIVKKILGDSTKTVLTDIEGILKNSTVEEFFKRFFMEAFSLYRYKCLGLSLSSTYFEDKIKKNYGRVPITRIEALVNNLIELKKVCGYIIDKDIMFYYITKILAKKE